MSLTEKTKMKTLTKIRLINWHYFTDETIDVKGSVLFSGDNASGKSTILDAIQLVLTTNTRRFNPAANEKSKRTLQGYVRCKTGDEGNVYLRANGPVISYVALEFYEESQNRYFVIGVKIDSHDIDDEPAKKWFCIDGEMNSLSFIVDGKPALDKEFTQNGKKIQFESQVGRARDNFRIRLGRLDETFGEMILKSMAFKPMDKVKDFINNYILPQRNIDTGTLQDNIRNLREMQKLVDEVKSQINQLKGIIDKADKIDGFKYDILVVDILITIALLESEKQKRDDLLKNKAENETIIAELQKKSSDLDKKIKSASERVTSLAAALITNECGQLISKIQDGLITVDGEIGGTQKRLEDYSRQIEKLKELITSAELPIINEMRTLQSSISGIEERATCFQKIKTCVSEKTKACYSSNAKCAHELGTIDDSIVSLSDKIESLRRNRLVYDRNTTDLQSFINEEFEKRGIDSRAEIFADLLEINPEMAEWQNAVEGYLNTQRFNIIVDPQYYDIAAIVYERNKAKIHTVGLVNAGKIMAEGPVAQERSLYYAVKSDNRYARAYAAYLLGRVICCDSVTELKDHSIAITNQCMKYQGHVLQKIREDIYKTPFIGKHALQVQLYNAEKELKDLNIVKESLVAEIAKNDSIIGLLNDLSTDTIESNIGASSRLVELKKRRQQLEKDLAEAKNNPNYIDLTMKHDSAVKAQEVLQEEQRTLKEKIDDKRWSVKDCDKSIQECNTRIDSYSREKADKCSGNLKAEKEAAEKFEDNIRKTKSAATIAENYGPRRQALYNQLDSEKGKLIEAQAKYKDGDFGTGLEVIDLYREDYGKLVKSDLISYEDKLAEIRKDCELEFRENFLAKMRENIEQAGNIIRQLNKSLQGIYYGNDSYKFELTANRERQSLYDMITSDVNVVGMSLFTSAFEEQYHNEMEDLFARLTDQNLNDVKVTNDLTDYRSYLDYDIQVISRDGKMQRFSKTYGEKSGGETQTPYYVAIAASFAQMYSGRETARIILLDEAFNNMDEERIESMMKFLTSQDFQIILASPPARMEIIGEYVDSIYLTIRRGNCSTVEEYYL